MILLPSLETAAFERFLDSVEVASLVVERLLELDRPGAGQTGGREPLLEAGAGELGDRRVAFFGAGVAAQARQRRRVALLADARIEQSVEAAEEHLPEIEVRQHQATVELRGVTLVAGRGQQDLQVLAHARIGGRGELRLEVARDRCEIRLEPRVVCRASGRAPRCRDPRRRAPPPFQVRIAPAPSSSGAAFALLCATQSPSAACAAEAAASTSTKAASPESDRHLAGLLQSMKFRADRPSYSGRPAHDRPVAQDGPCRRLRRNACDTRGHPALWRAGRPLLPHCKSRFTEWTPRSARSTVLAPART